MRRAANIAGTALTVGVVIVSIVVVVVLVIIPRATGGAALTVLSSSMEPTYSVGSTLLVVPVDPASVEPGEVITYQNDYGLEVFTTHRVVAVDGSGSELRFVTQGDANASIDRDPVPADLVRGTVRFHLPYIGYLGSLVQRPGGVLVLLVPFSLLVIIVQGRKIVRASRDADDPPIEGEGAEPPLTSTRA